LYDKKTVIYGVGWYDKNHGVGWYGPTQKINLKKKLKATQI
jgi:hypothetical protein